MKQIFDWLREHLSKAVKRYSEQVARNPYNRYAEGVRDGLNLAEGYIDEAEAKWNTTEAEIRAKAYDEFAEKLCDVFSEEYGEVTVNGIKFDVLTLDGATEITWEVAEQLKEE